MKKITTIIIHAVLICIVSILTSCNATSNSNFEQAVAHATDDITLVKKAIDTAAKIVRNAAEKKLAVILTASEKHSKATDKAIAAIAAIEKANTETETEKANAEYDKARAAIEKANIETVTEKAIAEYDKAEAKAIDTVIAVVVAVVRDTAIITAGEELNEELYKKVKEAVYKAAEASEAAEAVVEIAEALYTTAP